MNINVMRQMLSEYIDNALDEGKRREVEKLIKSDLKWEAEYRAMKKTASLLSRMEKVAAPDDIVKRVSTSIALSKKGLLQRFNEKFQFTLPRSPIINYLSLIIALVLIVFAGSIIMIKHNVKKEEEMARLVKDEKWMDKSVSREAKEFLEDGYKWYYLRLEDDGTFKIEYIGESKPEKKHDKDEVPPSALEDDKAPPSALARLQKPPESTAEKPGELKKKSIIREENGFGVASGSAQRGKVVPKSEKRDLAEEDMEIAKPQKPKSKETLRPAEKVKAGSAKVLTGDKPAAAKTAEKEGKSKDRRRSGEEAYSRTPAIAEQRRALEEKSKSAVTDELDGVTAEKEKQQPISAKQRPSKEDKGIITAYPEIIEIPQIEYIKKYEVPNRLITVELLIDKKGLVKDVLITEGSGDYRLDSLIKRTLMRAKFKPAYDNKGPIEIRFKLKIEIR